MGVKKYLDNLISTPYFYPFLLLILFLLQFLFVSPIGDFALNDSWVHADTIRHWLETGEFRLIPWAGPTFYLPILYGAGLAKIFGFSFTLFRITNLIVSLFTLLVLFFFLVEVTDNKPLSFISVLVFWLSPIFYNLSFTFMTEIPALFLVLVSIYYFYFGFKEDKDYYLFAGSLVSVVGFFVRQTNILIAVSALGYEVFRNYNNAFSAENVKRFIWIYLLPGLVCIAIYFYLSVLGHTPQSLARAHLLEFNWVFVKNFIYSGWLYLAYSALFLSPLLVAKMWSSKKDFKRYLLWVCMGVSLIISIAVSLSWTDRFSTIGHIINQFGLGPYRVMAGQPEVLLTQKMFLALDIFAGLSLGVLSFYLVKTRKRISDNTLFLLIFGFIYFIVVSSVTGFDRYLLPVFLIFLIWFINVVEWKNIEWTSCIFLLLIISIFSVTQTSHYLEWNRVRDNLANSVLNRGVSAQKIDAGVEWNGVHDYWNLAHVRDGEPPANAPWWIKDMFSANTRKYIVSFSDLSDYEVIRKEKIKSVLNPNNTVYLLKKR